MAVYAYSNDIVCIVVIWFRFEEDSGDFFVVYYYIVGPFYFGLVADGFGDCDSTG